MMYEQIASDYMMASVVQRDRGITLIWPLHRHLVLISTHIITTGNLMHRVLSTDHNCYHLSYIFNTCVGNWFLLSIRKQFLLGKEDHCTALNNRTINS